MNDDSEFIKNYENLLGLTVDITMNNNKKFHGNIYTLNKEAKMIILINKKNEKENFNINFINMLEIKKIELLKHQIDIQIDELNQINLEQIEKKEKINLENDTLMKRIETEPNFLQGYKIYETLSKFYDCTYDGKQIYIKEVDSYIDEPFKIKNIHCNNEKIRKKIESIIF